MKNLSYRTIKLTSLLMSMTLCLSLFAVGCGKGGDNESSAPFESTFSEEVFSSEETVTSSSSEVSSVVSQNTNTSSKKPSTSSAVQVVTKPSTSGTYNYNSNIDIEDNLFLDALVYTGYKLDKHRADGNMWKYILARYKKGLGYLSNITFAGGSTGFETTADGKPNIKAFERGGLVCASFATYVYFNYLPNVAGIDTSSLTRPVRSYSAPDFYAAAQDWVKKGQSYYIGFTAKDTASGISFSPDTEPPIGSILVFKNYGSSSNAAGHIAIYIGKKNGYHWTIQVGNKNGPEMCAVERYKFGPDPQWPLKIIATPTSIRMTARLELELKDDGGNAISGAEFKLKSAKTGKEINIGKTDAKGKLIKEGLLYGDYTLTQISAPEGYTLSAAKAIKLTTADNSNNKVKLENAAPKKQAEESSSDDGGSSSEESSSSQE